MPLSQVVSVACANDARLHLAPKEPGFGTSVHTLCLREWTDREPCRADSEFCPECLTKLKGAQ